MKSSFKILFLALSLSLSLLNGCNMRPSLNGAYQKEDGELGLEFLEGGKVVYQEKGSDPITLDYQVVKSQNGYKLVIGNKSEMIEKKGNSLILERSGELKKFRGSFNGDNC
jgi:hypothetical protein